MARHNVFGTIYRGEAKTLIFRMLTAVDMSAWPIRFCLLAAKSDPVTSALLTFTVGAGVTVTGQNISVDLQPAHTDRDPATYYISLVRTDTDSMLATADVPIGYPRAS